MTAGVFTDLPARQAALEASVAQLIADLMNAPTTCRGMSGTVNGNVATLRSEREGSAMEVQVIVKCGTPHEVRDDVWDALMDRMDMDVSMTDLANAALERLGFQRPDGGWPK